MSDKQVFALFVMMWCGVGMFVSVVAAWLLSLD